MATKAKRPAYAFGAKLKLISKPALQLSLLLLMFIFNGYAIYHLSIGWDEFVNNLNLLLLYGYGNFWITFFSLVLMIDRLLTKGKRVDVSHFQTED